MFRNDHAARADEGIGPERRRLRKPDDHREVVDLLDLEVLVAADRDGGGRRIGGVLRGEHHVVGRERLAVMPAHAALELPCDREAVRCDTAVLPGRELARQHREQIAVRVPAGQRLVEDAAGVRVLGANGEMRIEQRRTLPPQEPQCPAAAALLRLVFELLAARFCDTAIVEHLARHGRREPERNHFPHEGAARQTTGLHFPDETVQRSLIHDALSSRSRGLPPLSGSRGGRLVKQNNVARADQCDGTCRPSAFTAPRRPNASVAGSSRSNFASRADR